MRLAHPTRRLRRGAAFALLAVVLTAAALSLGQCRMVGENLTGISLDSAKPSMCLFKCVKTYNEAIRDENKLYAKNVRACNSDSLCLALENLRHVAVVDRITADRKVCLNECHHQGGGNGGY